MKAVRHIIGAIAGAAFVGVFSMAAQSAEMSKGLDRLGELVRTAPAGTVR